MTWFESRVILDGSQTLLTIMLSLLSFESRVILDGSQTEGVSVKLVEVFESRVILDGSQTQGAHQLDYLQSLRVVLF